VASPFDSIAVSLYRPRALTATNFGKGPFPPQLNIPGSVIWTSQQRPPTCEIWMERENVFHENPLIPVASV